MLTITAHMLFRVEALANESDNKALRAFLRSALTPDQRHELAALCEFSHGSYASFAEALRETPKEFDLVGDIAYLAAKVQGNKELLRGALDQISTRMN